MQNYKVVADFRDGPVLIGQWETIDTELSANCCHAWHWNNASREWRCADCGSVVREEDQQNKCG